MATKPTICLVTIHGIGFEQPPVLDADKKYTVTPGYADTLHKHLNHCLGTTLSDDPRRARHTPGEAGPIYVSSVWPPNSHRREEGLKRLGTWDEAGFRGLIDGSDAPLSDGTGAISHVALVYSELEGMEREIGPAAVVAGMTLLHLSHYASVVETMRLAFADTEPFWDHLLHIWESQPIDHPQTSTPAQPSLKVRRDLPKKQTPSTNGHALHGLVAVLRQLENDVAAYVCHNELRERVRGFVLDALLRLACRDDVEGIVINSHSNGTVVALDILRDLPPFAAKKILGFVTAGSPLRKYSDFFSWGEHMSTIPRIGKWLNFFDPKDPVADPLLPDETWKRGKPQTEDILTGLYKALDANTGTTYPLHISDREVDNLTNSVGGGLQAHNYWDNEAEFVKPLADLLQEFARRPAPVLSQQDGRAS